MFVYYKVLSDYKHCFFQTNVGDIGVASKQKLIFLYLHPCECLFTRDLCLGFVLKLLIGFYLLFNCTGKNILVKNIAQVKISVAN
jgi:hypothetical protein